MEAGEADRSFVKFGCEVEKETVWPWKETWPPRKVGWLVCVKIGETWVYLTGDGKEPGEREGAETQGEGRWLLVGEAGCRAPMGGLDFLL